MKETFPKFIPYWEEYKGESGTDEGFFSQLEPFEEYSLEEIKSGKKAEIKRIFDFVEFLLREGNESVQTAICTGYLEYLMSKDPDEIQFSTFVKYMGEEAIAYCKGWDEFTGVRTKGLW